MTDQKNNQSPPREFILHLKRRESGEEVDLRIPVVDELSPGLFLLGCDGEYDGQMIGGYEVLHGPSQSCLISGTSKYKEQVFKYAKAFSLLGLDWSLSAKLFAQQEGVGAVRQLVQLYKSGIAIDQVHPISDQNYLERSHEN